MSKVSDKLLRRLETCTGDIPLYSESIEMAIELLDLRAKAAAGKWVPLEPTQEMYDAAYDTQEMRQMWKAMLAVAPDAEKPKP